MSNPKQKKHYGYFQRIEHVWNKLPTDSVHASSINMFNNRMDIYLAGL